MEVAVVVVVVVHVQLHAQTASQQWKIFQTVDLCFLWSTTYQPGEMRKSTGQEAPESS